MTASKAAKAANLKGLKQVSELTGQSTQTLINWFNDKPELFEVVLLGCRNKMNLLNFNERKGLLKDIDLLISAANAVSRARVSSADIDRRLDNLEKASKRVDDQYRLALVT